MFTGGRNGGDIKLEFVLVMIFSAGFALDLRACR
jgi:hypothetical protein